MYLHILFVGWDSLVGIATSYAVDGSGIGSRGRARFSSPVQKDPGAHPASYTMGIGSFPGLKRPECGVYHPPQSSSEGKERVELYLYSQSGPSWPGIEWTLLFYLCTYYGSEIYSLGSWYVSNKYRYICFATNVHFYGIIYRGF